MRGLYRNFCAVFFRPFFQSIAVAGRGTTGSLKIYIARPTSKGSMAVRACFGQGCFAVKMAPAPQAKARVFFVL